MKMIFKLIMGLIVFIGSAAIIGGGLIFWWGSQEFVKPGAFDTPIEITIEKGDNIAERLLYEGAISNMYVFKIAGKLTGQDTKLKAGEYSIPAKSSMQDVLNLLEDGKVILRQITVREGLTNWEIKALLLAHDGLTKGNEFLMMPEGSYLPETYSYQKGETAADVMGQMNKAMENTVLSLCGILYERIGNASFNSLFTQDCPNAKAPLKTIRDVLTLASIVEKETSLPEERNRVAGVFINRLKRGIMLQTDPTVIYALTLGEHKNDGQGPLGRRILKKDLEIDSPYNTYRYAGLPPTPIANPGRAAIEATLNPETHDYIYFVADGNGGHAFAKTLDEHNSNVAKWRKIRAAQ